MGAGFSYSGSRFSYSLQSCPILSPIFKMTPSEYSPFQMKNIQGLQEVATPRIPRPRVLCVCPVCRVLALPRLQDSGLRLRKLQPALGCQEDESWWVALVLASGLVPVEPGKSCPRGLAGCRELFVFLFKQTQPVC